MMKIDRLVRGPALFFSLFIVTGPVCSQVIHPEAGFVFEDSEVPRIDLTISGSNLQNLYADPDSNMEYYAVFSFTRGDSTEGPIDVGLRFRGDTIRHKQKKSFRISFNSFDPDDTFHGIEKMDLNAEVNDPSLVRSKLGWELFRYLGVTGSRCNHVFLYINGAFYGVYLNTEHIDERFTKSRFDNNDGNLFRNLWPADLVYLGPSQDDYKYEYDGRRAYALRTNEEWDDYGDLSGLIATLEENSGSRLKSEIEPLINVQQFLKAAAVDVMTGNWDGYSGDKNNYYLYRDQVTGRFEYIPYNLENSLGIDFREVDWSTRSIYAWNLDLRPLYEKILEVDEYKAQFTMYIKQLAAYVVSTELDNEMVRWRQLIRDEVVMDTFYTKDWGFTPADFDAALNSGWGSHVDFGVREFLTARSASALNEAIVADALPLFSHVRMQPQADRIDLDWSVEDDETGVQTTLHYRVNGENWNTVVRDTPADTDPVSGVATFRDTIRIQGDTAEVELYFTAMDQGGQQNRYPDSTVRIAYPLVSGPLYINEFAASNNNIKRDEYGEYDDWMELYNAGAEQVWLADYFLSDNMGSPGKYRFPGVNLQPGDFYLVWLDGQDEQGVNHASFRIDKEGEELRLSERPSAGYRIVDSITFGLQETDISLGRQTDGGPEWIHFPSPTPNYSNLSTGMPDDPRRPEQLTIYPNPVGEGVFFLNRRASGGIYNLTGQLLMEVEESDEVHVPLLGAGLYIFRSREGESILFVIPE